MSATPAHGEPPVPAGRVYGEARQGLLTRVAEPLARRARERRHALYREMMAPRPGDAIVDVGCGHEGLAAFEHDAEITGLDAVDRPGYPGAHFVRGDARDLPFEPASFAIAYSNSLIEHIDPADRPRFAEQIRRVGRHYWVQTPNRSFPVEPHVLLPGFQFLPERVQRRLWRVGVLRIPYEPIHLLDAAELRELFPDAVILRERFAGLTKSLIAVGPRDAVGR
ncbi:MAG: methyltransferase domain-containing protein [Actinomycetota bacterium]